MTSFIQHHSADSKFDESQEHILYQQDTSKPTRIAVPVLQLPYINKSNSYESCQINQSDTDIKNNEFESLERTEVNESGKVPDHKSSITGLSCQPQSSNTSFSIPIDLKNTPNSLSARNFPSVTNVTQANEANRNTGGRDFNLPTDHLYSQLEANASNFENNYGDLEEATEDDETLESIEPDHYYGDTVPVFKPTMDQFRSFPKFIKAIDGYGMQVGIVKIIPPVEWTSNLPDLDDKVKDLRIKNPIVQHINGNGGVFTQTNIEKKRTYTLPQWRRITEESDHQPPARRGERRKGSERTKFVRKRRHVSEDNSEEGNLLSKPSYRRRAGELSSQDLVELENFNYRFDSSEFTAERCEELERVYWRTVSYNNPMYGADMLGSIFSDAVKDWNVAHLDNILNDIGVDLPGVNTAYLYFGMWKSTFSWHVEDMDLYSINYIHFGAPKQWYSISQKDEAKFYGVMRNQWPDEHRKCKEFLRHKTFLVSPAYLANRGIKVNKLVHNQGEFVVTFPHGYHSGYNLGYNCAESVNFATDNWLKIGSQAKKCNCISDAVDIDVYDLKQRLDMKRKQQRALKAMLPSANIVISTQIDEEQS
ncbi:JmjC domain, hydroxylase-domain-containing protein [Lipomyces arxii]|uniref:JmjC domain, hydroxylase-domain-containing protein n=1 Tax=Lipomyces arxii TaxID=56418 RepID=UPI0034CD8E8F